MSGADGFERQRTAGHSFFPPIRKLVDGSFGNRLSVRAASPAIHGQQRVRMSVWSQSGHMQPRFCLSGVTRGTCSYACRTLKLGRISVCTSVRGHTWAKVAVLPLPHEGRSSVTDGLSVRLRIYQGPRVGRG
jgi:hypothetical protein